MKKYIIKEKESGLYLSDDKEHSKKEYWDFIVRSYLVDKEYAKHYTLEEATEIRKSMVYIDILISPDNYPDKDKLIELENADNKTYINYVMKERIYTEDEHSTILEEVEDEV